MTIRILHVVTSMDVGGIETMLMNLYRNIDREKVQFDFLVNRSHKGFYNDEIISMGGRIYQLFPISLSSIKNYINELNSFFSDHKEYKIIHSHISIMSYLILKIAKKNNVPIRIAHSHESHKSFSGSRVSRKPIITYCKLGINNQTTHRFACSKEAGKWLFGDRHEVKVINNSIDFQRYMFSEAKRQSKRYEFNIGDKFVIGHIGNFSKAKNYPFILDVFKSVLKLNDNALLILIGKNDNNPEVEKSVSEMGLSDKVIFTGVRSDIIDLLQAMDVFLFPSINEGLPVTLIEAQASGLPCLVSDIITKEVKITEKIKFISLEMSSEYWAEEVLRFQNNKRTSEYDKTINSGYDIKKSVVLLQEFYMDLFSSL